MKFTTMLFMLCGQSIKNRSCVVVPFCWLAFSSLMLTSTVNAAVLKVEAVEAVSLGELVTFNILVTNDSNSAIELAKLTAQFISLANLVSIRADKGSCNDSLIFCDLGTIEANENVNVTVDVYPEIAEGVFKQNFTGVFDLQGSQQNGSSDEQEIIVKQNRTVAVTVIGASIAAGINIKEGEAVDARFFVKLNAAAPSNGITINFDVSGSAIEGQAEQASAEVDYSYLGRSITIPAGQTEAAILFQVVDDSLKEDSETVIVSLQAGDTYQLLEPQTATFTIEDNDASDAVGFRQGEYQFEENSGQVTIPVDRIGNTDQAVSVAFSIEAGDISVGEDVIFTSGVLNWAAGETATKNINFTLLNDDLDEGDESFRVLLSDPQGTVINTDKTTILIKGTKQNVTILGFDKISGGELSSLHLNKEQLLSVKLSDANGQARVDQVIVWSLNGEAKQRGGVFVVTNDGETSTTSENVTVMTDDEGIALITLKTGVLPGSYEVTATSTGDGPAATTVFKLAVGLENIAPADTPAAALAKTVDTVCPQLATSAEELNDNEKDLLNLCSSIVGASASPDPQDQEANKALSEMSPEEVAVTRLISQNVTLQQLGNITSRLAALRTGIRGLSLNQLSFRLNGKHIPSQVYSYLLPASVALGAVDSVSESNSGGGLLDNRLGVFVNGSINAGDKSETAHEDGFEFDNYGLTLGADYRVKSDVVVGGALGVSRSGVDINHDGGELDANGLSLSAYGTYYYSEKIYIDGILSVGWNDYDMSRRINYQLTGAEPVDRTASSQTDSNQKGLSFGAGYEFFRDKNRSANLFGRLEYVTYKIDAFSETGAQGLDVNINSHSANSLTSSIGGQASWVQTLSWGVVLPLAWLSWEHEYKANDNKIEGSFVNDPNQNQFSFETDEPDRNFFSAGAGASFVLPFGLSAYARYEVLLAKQNYTDRTLSFGARYELNF